MHAPRQTRRGALPVTPPDSVHVLVVPRSPQGLHALLLILSVAGAVERQSLEVFGNGEDNGICVGIVPATVPFAVQFQAFCVFLVGCRLPPFGVRPGLTGGPPLELLPGCFILRRTGTVDLHSTPWSPRTVGERLRDAEQQCRLITPGITVFKGCPVARCSGNVVFLWSAMVSQNEIVDVSNDALWSAWVVRSNEDVLWFDVVMKIF